jgi:ribonucleoside-diphosphate reductase alpha chain
MSAKEIVSIEDSKRDSLKTDTEAVSDGLRQATNAPAVSADSPPAVRRRMPDERRSLTHHFCVGGQEGYVTVGLYEDGVPGEMFIWMSKEGSTVSGLMDSFATAVSLALQYGVPL